MDTFDEYLTSSYATNLRLANVHRCKSPSLHHHQYSTDDSQCIIEGKLKNGDTFTLGCPNPEVRLEFCIGGGTDNPFFQLTLVLKQIERKMFVRYFAWAPKGNSIWDESPRIIQATGKFVFSRRLYNVELTENNPLPRALDGIEELLKNWGKKEHTRVSWMTDEVIGYNMEIEIPETFLGARAAASVFKKLADRNSPYSVTAYLRGNQGVVAGFRDFCKQPHPPLPTWWRYAGVPECGPLLRDLPQIEHLSTHHRRRVPNWTKLPIVDVYTFPPEYIPMGVLQSFTDEREYEIFTLGGLLREHSYQESIKANMFNGSWFCNIAPLSEIDCLAEPDAYLVTAHFEQRVGKGFFHIAGPPSPGTNVQITFGFDRDFEGEVWIGRVVPHTLESTVANTTIFALRLAGGSSMVLGDGPIRAKFEFNHFSGPLNIQCERIWWMLYGEPNHGIPRDNWLKAIILARNDQSGEGRLPDPLHVPSDDTRYIIKTTMDKMGLDESQRKAFQVSVRPEGGISLIQGPPGTGKTLIVSGLAIFARRMGFKMLILSSSNATGVVAARIKETLSEFGFSVEGVYRVERQSTEVYMGFARGGSFTEDDDTDSFSARIRKNLERLVSKDVDGLSLGWRILKSLQDWAEGTLCRTRTPSRLQNKELKLIEDLHKAIYTPHVPSGDPRAGHTQKGRDGRLNKAWVAVQRFYLRQARIIITTCTSSGSPIMQDYRPQLCVVDEASQLPETECLVPLVTFLPSISSIVLIGDQEQLKPTVASAGSNEFYAQRVLSLFRRLILSGHVQSTMLSVQYRMHPSICHFPNQHFYNLKLRNDPSTSDRATGMIFETWARRYKGCDPQQRSIFIDVTDGELLQELKGFSNVNIHSAGAILAVIDSMVRQHISPEAILVLSFYEAQVSLIRRLISVSGNPTVRSIRVKTVDSAQGSESPFVVLDVVTTGDKGRPLGYAKDPNRLNVAITRARDGLVFVGNSKMADIPKNRMSKWRKLWKDFVDAHKGLRTWRMEGYANTVHAQLEGLFFAYEPIKPGVRKADDAGLGDELVTYKRKRSGNDDDIPEQPRIQRRKVVRAHASQVRGPIDAHITQRSEKMDDEDLDTQTGQLNRGTLEDAWIAYGEMTADDEEEGEIREPPSGEWINLPIRSKEKEMRT